MKKSFLLVALFLLIGQFTKASEESLNLDVSITYATFKTPDQPYVEIYLHVLGASVEKVLVNDSLFQSKVEVVTIFKQGENIIKFDKYILESPVSTDIVNFYDIKRYGLANGTYDMEVVVRDINKAANARVFKSSINIDYGDSGLMQSDIGLLSAYHPESSDNPAVKNGYYLEALPFNFYHKNISSLIFYNEIYNTDQAIGDDFLVRYIINKVQGNGEVEAVMIGNKKRKPQSVNVILLSMDISELQSGNYNLTVEIRNRTGELLSNKEILFQRSNPYLDLEIAKEAPLEKEFVAGLDAQELRYSLKAIAPIANDADSELINILIGNRDSLEAQRRYLFTFWVAYSPNEPEKSYRQYMEVAKAVDALYNSGFGYGFESDRGNIFMKYGKPDDILTVETDASAPPYEMWLYNDFPKTKQTRVKFLFYNPSLATGDYRLLHSTAFGELNNPQWERYLYSDAPEDIEGRDFISGTNMNDGINRNARRLFEDF
jgi:GWxTD domain-containing protein